MRLLDSETSFGSNADGLYISYEQAIPSEFIDSLKSERAAKEHLRAAEMDRVASIPTAVVEIWLRRGIPFYQMSAREIVARLSAEGLDAFISTPKRV